MQLNPSSIPENNMIEGLKPDDFMLSKTIMVGPIEIGVPLTESTNTWARARYLADAKQYNAMNPSQNFKTESAEDPEIYLVPDDVLYETSTKRHVVVTEGANIYNAMASGVYETTTFVLDGKAYTCPTLYRLKDRGHL